jgi:hypothetical protein
MEGCMTEDSKPLSVLVGQGWEVVGYSGAYDLSGYPTQNVLLRRQKQHRILSIRPKRIGKGYVVRELDI